MERALQCPLLLSQPQTLLVLRLRTVLCRRFSQPHLKVSLPSLPSRLNFPLRNLRKDRRRSQPLCHLRQIPWFLRLSRRWFPHFYLLVGIHKTHLLFRRIFRVLWILMSPAVFQVCFRPRQIPPKNQPINLQSTQLSNQAISLRMSQPLPQPISHRPSQPLTLVTFLPLCPARLPSLRRRWNRPQVQARFLLQSQRLNQAQHRAQNHPTTLRQSRLLDLPVVQR